MTIDSVVVPYLDCDHCGGVAIESEDGMFGDGDGGKCASCGFPGHVSVDDSGDEYVAYWVPYEPAGEPVRCADMDCAECNGRVARL